MIKHEELKALTMGMNKADCVGCHEYFMNRYGADSVGPITDYLRNPRGYWTFERIHTEALKYETRSAFYKGSPSAYNAARRLGIMDEVCAHMDVVRQSWDDDSITAEALKYQTRGEFKKGSKSAYNAAKHLGIFEQVCAHMKLVLQSWDAVSLAEEALKYETRWAFQQGSGGAYRLAYDSGILDEVCAHMPKHAKWGHKKGG